MLALADLRREYTLSGLRRTDLDPDPLAQFAKWFEQALAAKVPEPNAMTLATLDKQGHPSVRMVLLKSLDERGFQFFTSYESRKGGSWNGTRTRRCCFFGRNWSGRYPLPGRSAR